MKACASTSWISHLSCALILCALACSCGVMGCKSAPAPVSDPSVGAETTSTTNGAEAQGESALEAPPGEKPGAFVTRSEPGVLRQVTSLNTASELGAEGEVGYLLWSSTHGELAVMAIFEDSDGDGSVAPRFGQHGEPLGDQAKYHLFETKTGKALGVYDEVLVWDAQKRFISLQRAATPDVVDIFDAERMEHISLNPGSVGALTSASDGNDCLTPRHIHITPKGQITLVSSDERELIRTTFDALRGGGAGEASPQRVKVFSDRDRASARIWRVESAGSEWLSLLFVDQDTDGDGAIALPQQRTSCACRFCPRFAVSFGFYGWGGDEWSSKLLAPDGRLSKSSQDRAIPLSPEVVLEVGSEQYASWPEQAPLKDDLLTAGCSHAPWLHGETPGAVMICPAEVDAANEASLPRLVVWRPRKDPAWVTLEGVEADAPAQHVVRSPERQTAWFASIYREAIGGMVDGKVSIIRRLARVRVEDARVEFLDVPLLEGAPLRWFEPGLAWSVSAGEELIVLDVREGRGHVLQGARGEVMEGEQGEVLFDVDTKVWTTTGMSKEVGRVVSGRLDEACVVMGGELDGSPGLEKGPWRVQCVRASGDTEQERE